MGKKNDIESKRAELIRAARENCVRNLDSIPYKQQREICVNPRDEIFIGRRIFMIRLVCAALLFISIVAFDQLGIKYRELESSSIKEAISSNKTLNEVEKFLTEITEEKIIPIFNGLQ